jgi:cell division transport system permease protein
MTVAAIVTMAVSLAALGGVLLMRQAINKASIQWKGGVQLAIFLQPNISDQETAAIGQQLHSTPGIRTVKFVNKPQAYQEFKQIFGSDNEIVSALSASDMPPSYRVVPSKAQDVTQLGDQFKGVQGVLRVSYAQQEIDTLLHHFKQLRFVAIVLLVMTMVGAVALIVNTIQLAIFARRREVAVMKLVGATNWFIRVPFMLEGFIHGIVGGLIAFLVSYFARNTIAGFVGNESLLGNQQLYVSSHEAVLTGIIVLIVGAGVGVVGSAFAVRRFLAV